jgi:predicted unusual protein kinase regulating ubiquinone biosynthesis (AarF/ABC1/UbiB family)
MVDLIMASSEGQDRLKKIKTGVLSRGLALAKVSMTAGAKVASHTVGNLFASESEKTDRFKDMLVSQINLLTRELGQLKGSLMKVGQLLSMYGEHFLPPEANALLKSLQSQSPPLEWKEIEKVLKRQLTQEKLDLLEIDPNPIGSASLGQVHRAQIKADGRWVAMKVQYPGVDKAIEGDLKALQSILSVSKLIPRGPKLDDLFNEVRSMLHQEVDYARELEQTEEFRVRLVDDPRYVIATPFPEFSSRRVLTTSYEVGVPVDGQEVLSLPLDRRNAIGEAMLELYFRELFEFGAVQTDPHFGNYRVRLSAPGSSIAKDQLILFDFGAVRKFSKTFLESYREMVTGSHKRDQQMLLKGASGLGFILPEDSEDLKQVFTELCYLISEPFYSPSTPGVPAHLYAPNGAYRWGESDLPKRAAKKGTELALAFKMRTPPREILFLDRKMGGMFIFLSVLKAEFPTQSILAKYIR